MTTTPSDRMRVDAFPFNGSAYACNGTPLADIAAEHGTPLYVYSATELGRRYRLDSALPDEEFVQRLTAFNPQRDYNTLAGLLARLQDPNLSENQLIQLAQAVHDQLHERQNGT